MYIPLTVFVFPLCFHAGVRLRDAKGIANVKSLTGNKILRILKAKVC